jgi:hypothetical protein
MAFKGDGWLPAMLTGRGFTDERGWLAEGPCCLTPASQPGGGGIECAGTPTATARAIHGVDPEASLAPGPDWSWRPPWDRVSLWLRPDGLAPNPRQQVVRPWQGSLSRNRWKSCRGARRHGITVQRFARFPASVPVQLGSSPSGSERVDGIASDHSCGLEGPRSLGDPLRRSRRGCLGPRTRLVPLDSIHNLWAAR